MAKRETSTIDALFGSKTRVKLLHLFLNNPDKSFYVREITRLIDEQINSVRRELSNMMSVGVVVNDTVDNKLYYKVNKSYQFFQPFQAIFAPELASKTQQVQKAGAMSGTIATSWAEEIRSLKGVRIAIVAGILVEGSASNVDLCLVGSVAPTKLRSIIQLIEQAEGREINYTAISYDEFYYRLSVRDRFIMEILTGKHAILVDEDNVVANYSN